MFEVCSSWNAFLSARTLLASTAATSRVKQLYVRLEALEAPKAPGGSGLGPERAGR